MTPAFHIAVDGTDITAQIRYRLLSLRLTDEAGMQSDTVELSIDDRDGLIELPRTGANMSVSLGYDETGLFPMGQYTVDERELSGPPQTMTIRARAADLRQSLKAPKTRPWDDTSLGAMIEKVAAEHGYQPRISEALAAIELDHVDQTDESDLHLLTRLARQHDATVKLACGFLVMTEKGGLTSVSGQALSQIELTPAHITDWRATLPERGKYPAVKAHYHDAQKAKRTAVTAGSGEPVFTLRHTYATPNQAQSAARAKLAAFERGLATLSLTLPGRPELAAEGGVTLSGFRTGVNGSWAISRVEHALDAAGYVCQLEAEVPKL